jgi:precorrin-3B methylase
MTNEANKAGALVIVGTGIRTVGQLTMEALAWMQRAEEIIHLLADHVS